jgi:acetyl-CoA carboxylase biotin carboxyl carrier protein
MGTVQSPLPGVFYRRPSPEEDEFVQTGDDVSEGQTIGLVEVMKSFNELKATQSGTVKEFLVEHGGEVTPGQDVAVIE